MIKCVLFDLDNVLVPLSNSHFEALNRALREVAGEKFIITLENRDLYEALSTRTKLDMLVKDKNLPIKYTSEIFKLKQQYTSDAIESIVKKSDKLIEIMKYLKDSLIKVGVVSNAIDKTIRTCLDKLEISRYIDYVVPNEATFMNKPNPQPYLTALAFLNVSPYQSLVIEDSYRGGQSAVRAGCHLMKVNNCDDVTLENIKSYIEIYS